MERAFGIGNVNRFILDTDIYSLFLRRNAEVVGYVVRHEHDELSITIVSVQELWGGWSAALAKAKSAEELAYAYGKLTATIHDLKDWRVTSCTSAAVIRYQALKKLKLNIGANDLRIASIALELGATVASRNLRDFQRVPGLQVVDWSQPVS